MSQMDVDHRRDSRTEQLCREAARAIDALLTEGNRIHPELASRLKDAHTDLKLVADHIVAVWD